MGKLQRTIGIAVHGNFSIAQRFNIHVAKRVPWLKKRPLVLYKAPMPRRAGHSARRINRLLTGLPLASSYLEIGLHFGGTLQNVTASVRWGVDPKPLFDVHRLPPGVHVHVGTSDEFFDCPSYQGIHFDVVFLDGLHTFRQTYRDLVNALRLCPDGIVLMDDVVPIDEVSAMPNRAAANEAHRRLQLSRRQGIWHGDVFRVLLILNYFHPELAFCTIEEPDNAQALIWKKQGSTPVQSASESELKSFDEVDYRDIFSEGIPSYFLPTTEDVGLGRALSGCLAGRSGLG